MSFGDLRQNSTKLVELDRANKTLAAKLAIANGIKDHESSNRFLLNFELSLVKTQISEALSEIESLEDERRRLIETNQELAYQNKLVRNYFSYVNSLQMDRKAEYLQNLRAELSALDFTLEAKNDEPGQSVDSFTQLSRRA